MYSGDYCAVLPNEFLAVHHDPRHDEQRVRVIRMRRAVLITPPLHRERAETPFRWEGRF